MRPEIDFAGRAIQGARDDQEDYYAFEVIDDKRLLLVLADGAGGQASGELASRQAAMGFLDAYADLDGGALPNLKEALVRANRRLAEFMDRDPSKRTTMATTLTAVLVDEHHAHWISVGDSPLLLFREGKIERLNEDHSGAGDPSGKMARNVLRSALVGGRIPLIDWRRDPFALKEGDILVLASDGVWTLTEKQIVKQIAGQQERKASEIAAALISAIQARKKLRQDNVTVAVIKR
jgi:PPM family protein phosphatase